MTEAESRARQEKASVFIPWCRAQVQLQLQSQLSGVSLKRLPSQSESLVRSRVGGEGLATSSPSSALAEEVAIELNRTF